MGKLSRNRKGLKSETVVTLWKNVQTKITVKELRNVLELPRSIFYRSLQRTEDLKDDIGVQTHRHQANRTACP
ncbi:Transposase [Bacillus cereus 172560W]|nr:Transposase [Bacillus cereus 172560W]